MDKPAIWIELPLSSGYAHPAHAYIDQASGRVLRVIRMGDDGLVSAGDHAYVSLGQAKTAVEKDFMLGRDR